MPRRAVIVSRMRWDSLFDDLESQLERERTAEELDLEAEEERLRLGRLAIRDRLVALAAAPGERPLRIALVGGGRLTVPPRMCPNTLVNLLQRALRGHRACVLNRFVRETQYNIMFTLDVQQTHSPFKPPHRGRQRVSDVRDIKDLQRIGLRHFAVISVAPHDRPVTILLRMLLNRGV